MKSLNILVLGGKGKTGGRIAERLAQKNINIRIGSRSENPSFDWNKPDTWDEVLDGIDKVYISYQPDLAVPGAWEDISVFTAKASAAGVQKLVLLSGKGEKEAERCEEVVMNSDMKWTIIRASWFNQNFSESFFLDPLLAGHVALPKKDALVPYVDVRDIADVAVKALLDDRHNGQIYELTGPRLWTFDQVVHEISTATGRQIRFQPITMEEYAIQMNDFGVPDDYIWLINYLFNEVLTESNAVVTNDVERVLGRKSIDFADFVKETAAKGVWNQQELAAAI